MSGAPSIPELKGRLNIPQAWRLLGLSGQPAASCKSPFRPEEKHPSFSVYADGTRAKDHATGETFDVVDFVRKALGADMGGALRWMRERLGEPVEPTSRPAGRPAQAAKPWPELHRGSETQLAALASLRRLPLATIRLVDDRGFLYFGEWWGHFFWCITDESRRCCELRRLDGEMWPAFREVPARKAHCYGDKTWPVGIPEAEGFPNLLLVEGVGDFLAAHAPIDAEVRRGDVAVICCLGAAVRFTEEAAATLTGKRVRIVPQMDEPGMRAAVAWARSLRAAGAVVDAFSLAGVTDSEGRQIKDFGDLFAQASSDSILLNPHLLEICP